VLRYRNTVSLTKKGFAIEAAILDAFLRQSMCRKRAYTLTSADFARYRDERLIAVLPVTLRREFCILHNMFEIARREWALTLPVNPVSGVRLEPIGPARQRRLRAGEEQKLIAVASRARNCLLRPAIELAIQTGLRRSELLRLTWSDVDLPTRHAQIPDSKNGHPRHVVLTHRAVEVLCELPRTHGRVFPMSPNALRLAWERIRRRAGCPDLHFHDLRHEAISRFFEMGLTTPEVASIGGHRDIRMLIRYAHPMRQRIIEQMDKGETRQRRQK
jgi:integrase